MFPEILVHRQSWAATTKSCSHSGEDTWENVYLKGSISKMSVFSPVMAATTKESPENTEGLGKHRKFYDTAFSLTTRKRLESIK